MSGHSAAHSACPHCRAFHKVNFVKEEAIKWALSDGYEVALTDTDIVWVKNPMQDLRENISGFDYAFQTARVTDDGQYTINGGLLYVKPTRAGIAALDLLLALLYEVDIQ